METVSDESPIHLTQSAARRVWELLSIEGNYNLKLRIYITGGGCSGFQYGFAFDEELKPDDCVVSTAVAPVEDAPSETNTAAETQSVQAVIDPMSLMYLTGATVDYVESLQGAHFTVKNPNAQTTCSCGSSFAL